MLTYYFIIFVVKQFQLPITTPNHQNVNIFSQIHHIRHTMNALEIVIKNLIQMNHNLIFQDRIFKNRNFVIQRPRNENLLFSSQYQLSNTKIMLPEYIRDPNIAIVPHINLALNIYIQIYTINIPSDQIMPDLEIQDLLHRSRKIRKFPEKV
jgi:hypothetical protein